MKAPDWSEWNYIPEVEVWQAVALSMNLEPNALRRNTDTPLLGFGSFFKEGTFLNIKMELEFEKRIRLLLSNLVDKTKFPQGVINNYENRCSKVNLIEFSVWARTVECFRNIPNEILNIAKISETITQSLKDDDSKKIGLNSDLSKQVKENLTGWKLKAREIGGAWMLKQEKINGKKPTVAAIAEYLEGELSNRNITGMRGKFLDKETIKREALTGITGRARGENMKVRKNRKKG